MGASWAMWQRNPIHEFPQGWGTGIPLPVPGEQGVSQSPQPRNAQFVPVTHQAVWSKSSPSCCTIPSAKDAPGSPGSCHFHLSMLTWHHQPSKVPTPQNTCWLCMAWDEKGEGLGQFVIPVLDPAAKVASCSQSFIHCQRGGGLGSSLSQGSCGCCSNQGHGSGFAC